MFGVLFIALIVIILLVNFYVRIKHGIPFQKRLSFMQVITLLQNNNQLNLNDQNLHHQNHIIQQMHLQQFTEDQLAQMTHEELVQLQIQQQMLFDQQILQHQQVQQEIEVQLIMEDITNPYTHPGIDAVVDHDYHGIDNGAGFNHSNFGGFDGF